MMVCSIIASFQVFQPHLAGRNRFLPGLQTLKGFILSPLSFYLSFSPYFIGFGRYHIKCHNGKGKKGEVKTQMSTEQNQCHGGHRQRS